MTFTLRSSTEQEFAIAAPLSIGRAPECEIQIADSLASRVHARVWVESGQLLVRDQRSSNGTFVNGRPLTPGEAHELHPGDVVRIGQTTFTVTVGTGQAASPPPRPPVAAANVPPGVTARVPASPAAAGTIAAPAPASPSRSRAPTLVIGGCLVLGLLVVCVGLGIYGATAGRPALGTALAQVARQSTPGPGNPLAVTPGPVTPGLVTPGPTSPAQPGNVSVKVLPTVPTASPMAPAAYASNSQDAAAALAELNQAQLRFIRDAHTGSLASGSLIDDLLNIAAAAFKLATGAENLVRASAVQAGGSSAAGQVADLYAGLAQYGYAQALDAQNLRLALANGSLDAPGAAARVADYGARAWNPTVVDPAVPGNPFLPFVANPGSIPVAAPLSPAGAAALQTGLGPQAALQSWIAASAQTVTRTVSFPRPIRPLGDPQDPALLASLSTATGQADGDRASQAAAAGLQRLGATVSSSTGSHSASKLADLAAQSGAQAMSYADTAAMIMSADQKPGGKDLPAFPGGTAAALAKGAPAAGADYTFINNVFGQGDDNAPTKTGEVPVKTAAPLVTLSIHNVQIGKVDKVISTYGADVFWYTVHWSFDLSWQTKLLDPHLTFKCTEGASFTGDGSVGTGHVTGESAIDDQGTITLFCFAGDLSRPLGHALQKVSVGKPVEVPQPGAPPATPTPTATSTSTPTSTATATGSPTATATDAGVFTLNGTFNLIQDDSGCSFADAPRTSGTIQMNVNFKSGQVTATFTGGGGGTRSLKCGDDTGSMHWQQSYTVDWTGTVDPTSGALLLTGTLTGSNNVNWTDCKHGDQDQSCPAAYARSYSFPVTLSGTVDKNNHSGSGNWQVQKITLPTSGDWGGGYALHWQGFESGT